jgi:hypothetical protein
MPSSRPHLPGRVPCSLCRCGRCAAPDACLLPRLALCPLQLPPTPLTASADADAMDGRAELAAAAVASAAPPLPPLQCLATPRTHHQNPSCQAHRCRRAVALLASSPRTCVARGPWATASQAMVQARPRHNLTASYPTADGPQPPE